MELPFVPLIVLSTLALIDIPFSALHNAWSPILASIFAGNGVVLKCSENVGWSTTWFVDVIRDCLRACKHSPELVQVIS